MDLYLDSPRVGDRVAEASGRQGVVRKFKMKVDWAAGGAKWFARVAFDGTRTNEWVWIERLEVLP